MYQEMREGGRALASIEDSVHALIQLIEDYIEKHGRWLITILTTRWTTEWQ